MKKTRKKSLIYSTPNCNTEADFDSYSCLSGKDMDSSISLKSVLLDETITLGNRMFYLVKYALDEQENNDLLDYFMEWVDEASIEYVGELTRREAYNIMAGSRSPLNTEDGMNRLINYLKLN